MTEHCNTPFFNDSSQKRALHSILQCWLLSVSTHRKQSALQNGMGLTWKTYNTHMHHSLTCAHTQTKWEQTTDKKIERNTVQRRMEGLLRKQQFSLEERREKWATIGNVISLYKILNTDNHQSIFAKFNINIKSERPLECLNCYFSAQNIEYW